MRANRPALSQAGKLDIHPGHDFLMRDAWPWVVDGGLNLGGQPCGVFLLGRGHSAASHGLMTVSPAASKGVVSRVATAKPLACLLYTSMEQSLNTAEAQRKPNSNPLSHNLS